MTHTAVKNEELEFPEIPPRLLNELVSRFPNRPVGPADSLSAIMYAAGQQSIIQFLKFQKEQQDNVCP